MSQGNPEAHRSQVDPEGFFDRTLEVTGEPTTLLPGESIHLELADHRERRNRLAGVAIQHLSQSNYFMFRRFLGVRRQDSELIVRPGLIRSEARLPDEAELQFDTLPTLTYLPGNAPRIKHKPFAHILSYTNHSGSVFNITNKINPDYTWENHQEIIVAPGLLYPREAGFEVDLEIDSIPEPEFQTV